MTQNREKYIKHIKHTIQNNQMPITHKVNKMPDMKHIKLAKHMKLVEHKKRTNHTKVHKTLKAQNMQSM